VEVRAEIDIDRAAGAELVENSREPALEQPCPCGEQEMRVTTLRNLSAWLGPVGQPVTVDDDHGVEAIGQHTSSAQPGHACADHDCRSSQVAAGPVGCDSHWR
jgi:hypothetical protein